MNSDYWKTHRQGELDLLRHNLKVYKSRLKNTQNMIDTIERQMRGIIMERVLQREIVDDELGQEKLV